MPGAMRRAVSTCAHALSGRLARRLTERETIKLPPHHRCRVLATPWPGVYGTQIDSAVHFGRHWHDTYGIGIVEHGAQASASGRGGVEAYAGDLITTNPGEVHDGRPLAGAPRQWRMVYLDPPVLATLHDAGATIALAQPVIRGDAALRDALRLLFARLDAWNAERATEDGGVATLACEESLAHVGALLLRRHATRPARAQPSIAIARVRERLGDERLAAPTLAELASLSGASKFQVLRRFAEAFGAPPHAWWLARRGEHARGLIRRGASLADAALASGFADQSHMTRVFVRQFGFTPGAWRQAVIGAVIDDKAASPRAQ